MKAYEAVGNFAVGRCQVELFLQVSSGLTKAEEESYTRVVTPSRQRSRALTIAWWRWTGHGGLGKSFWS